MDSHTKKIGIDFSYKKNVMLYNLLIVDDISCEVEDLRGLLFDQVKVLLVEGVRNGLVHSLAEFVDHSGSGLGKKN